MNHIEYFKLQAKNLYKDYKTQTSYIDEVDGNSYYRYDPKYYDLESIFLDYDWDEENFSLMKAQHLLSLMVGFDKWTDLLRASDAELELSRLLLDNQDKISLDDWLMYVGMTENSLQMELDSESKLEIFKVSILDSKDHHNPFPDYRLNNKK